MANMQKDVITMLFTGDYCYAHTVEKQDTSPKIAGNGNIGSDENPEGGKHPIKGGQIGDRTLNMSHPFNGRKSIPDGHSLLRASTP